VADLCVIDSLGAGCHPPAVVGIRFDVSAGGPARADMYRSFKTMAGASDGMPTTIFNHRRPSVPVASSLHAALVERDTVAALRSASVLATEVRRRVAAPGRRSWSRTGGRPDAATGAEGQPLGDLALAPRVENGQRDLVGCQPPAARVALDEVLRGADADPHMTTLSAGDGLLKQPQLRAGADA
jgi:hypothetical protein